MPFQPAPGIAQVNIVADYFGVPVENVYHVIQGETTIPFSDLTGIASLAATSWLENVLNQLSQNYVVTEIQVRDLSIDGGGVVTDTSLAGAQGVLAGDSEPGNVAFCISLRTGFSGRSFRGRTYLCGLIASEVVNNDLTGARAIAMVAAIDAFRADFASAFWPLGVLSRVHNGAPRATAIATPVTNVLAVRNRVSTQRRRLD